MIRRLLTIFSINFTTGVRKSKPLSLLSVKVHIHISYNMSDRIFKLLWKACIQQLISTASFFNDVCATEFFCNCWKIRFHSKDKIKYECRQRWKTDQSIKLLRYDLNRRILLKNRHLYKFRNHCRESNNFIYCI